MIYVLYTLFFLSCIVLVATVLLQPGKTDAGALFTSNVSSSAFGPRGTATVLSKITIAAAVLFMLSALMISMPVLTGGVSVLNTASEEAPVEAPPANTTESNTNGALIETPATEEFKEDAAANTNAAPANANLAPANTNATRPASR